MELIETLQLMWTAIKALAPIGLFILVVVGACGLYAAGYREFHAPRRNVR